MTSGRARKVAIVYQHLPHYRYEIFRALDERGDLEVAFFADDHSSDSSIEVVPHAALKRAHVVSNRWIGPLLWQRGLLRSVAGFRPDAVVMLGDFRYMSTWVVAAFFRLRKTPVHFWTIGWHRSDSYLRGAVRLAFYRLATSLMLYGETGLNLGRTAGYPSGRMVVIGNSSGSYLTEMSAKREEIGQAVGRLGDRDVVIGCVIRLNPTKSLDQILRAAALIRAAGRDVGVLIVGEGPERPRLIELAVELGVPLELPGAAYARSDLQRTYDRLDACVIPSIAGLSVIQALSFGCPVVTNGDRFQQAPESAAVIPGRTGELFEVGSIEDLAAKTLQVVDRARADPTSTRLRCLAEVNESWSAEAQAERIASALAAQDPRGGAMP